MLKKLVLLVSVLLVGYFLYYGFQQMKIAQKPKANLYSQIPSTSILIWEINDISDQWSDLEANNIIWEELGVFTGIQKLKKSVRSLDSTLRIGPYSFLLNTPIVFSIVPIATNYGCLIQIQSPSKLNSEQMLSFLQSSLKMKKMNSITDSIFHLSNSHSDIYVCERNGITSISTDLQLIENFSVGIKTSIVGDASFVAVKKTSSKNANNRLLLKPDAVIKSLERYGSDHTQLQIITLPSTSSWIELDVDVKPDEISMGGFAYATDSLKHWITIFKDQEAMPLAVSEYMPNKTAFFIQFGFSDFNKMRSKMISLESERTGSDFNYPIHQWDSIYGISIETEFLDWIDNEIALSIVEPEEMEIKSEGLVWINSSDSRTLINSLSDMVLKIDNQKELELQQIHYKEYVIQKLNISGFLETCLGTPFSMITENYFLRLEDYIVFSNSPATLQWCVDRFTNGKTLEKNEAFQSFSTRISEKSNIFIFSNVSKSPTVYKHITSNTLKVDMDRYLDIFKKSQGFSLQISHESDDLYYVNTYLKYNPVGKKMPNTLWETKIKFASTFKPVILKNHYTQGKEIFIQDTSNTIYLIDNKGKILWNRKLSASIMSDVEQIDMYKNNKLQIIFNTAEKIYLIDRNGHDVSNFPIQLPRKASASILVADYDNNQTYRILVPTIDGEILNYSIRGKSTKGWNYTSNGNVINQPLKFIRIKERDYLIAVYSQGEIIALNRRGEIRLQFKSKFNHPIKGELYIEPGSHLNTSYLFALTEHQDFVRISLDDQKDVSFSILKDSIEHFDFNSIDGDHRNELLVFSKNKLTAYTQDGQQVFNFSIRKSISYKPYVYSFRNGPYFGLVSFNANKIMLQDKWGETIHPFPLKGASPFTISDLNNDGRLNIITTDKDGYILNYTIN